jgi:hypothetical protein
MQISAKSTAPRTTNCTTVPRCTVQSAPHHHLSLEDGAWCRCKWCFLEEKRGFQNRPLADLLFENFCGFRVIADPSLPAGEVRFVQGGRVVARMVGGPR